MVMSTRFKEDQGFRQWWLWLIVLLVALLPLYGVYKQLVLGVPFGDKPLSDTGLIVFAGMMLALVALFYFVKLTLIIDKEGVFMRLFPFTKRMISWDKIDRLEVVNYGFVGGYGIRLTKKFGTVYNVSGNQGLLIELKGGEKFCIGTNRKAEVEQTLKDLGKA